MMHAVSNGLQYFTATLLFSLAVQIPSSTAQSVACQTAQLNKTKPKKIAISASIGVPVHPLTGRSSSPPKTKKHDKSDQFDPAFSLTGPRSQPLQKPKKREGCP